MKRTIEFLDKERNKVTAECEISERNGYPEFTMCGDYGGGGGQVFDNIVPDGDNQKKLIEIWKEWHLNGMCAGTDKQEKAISEWKETNKYDYAKAVEYLASIDLLIDIHPVTGDSYKYGSGWITKSLPEDFEDELNDLLDEIESEEEEKSERPVEETDIDLFDDFNDSECALALALMLDLCINEIDDIVEERNNRWCVQGTDYLAGTDEEMDEFWDEDLNNYLEECVYPDLPDHLRNYFDDEAWKSDARVDGRGHSLNHWDSSELSYCINSTWYYAYRQ